MIFARICRMILDIFFMIVLLLLCIWFAPAIRQFKYAFAYSDLLIEEVRALQGNPLSE